MFDHDYPTVAKTVVREWKSDPSLPPSPALARLLALALGLLGASSGRLILRHRRRPVYAAYAGIDLSDAIAAPRDTPDGLSFTFDLERSCDGIFEAEADDTRIAPPAAIVDALRATIAASLAEAVEVRMMRQLLRQQSARATRAEQLTAMAETMARIGSWQLDAKDMSVTLSAECQTRFDLDPARTWTLEDLGSRFRGHEEDDWATRVRKALRDRCGAAWTAETTRADGRVVWIQHALEVECVDGKARRVLGLMRDVTDEQTGEQALWRMAHIDGLTGAPNRNYWASRLNEAHSRAKASDGRFTILMFDLDGFKEINDTRGHAAGDAVLIEVARRSAALVSDRGFFARLGGDEFAILLEGDVSGDDVAALVRMILSSIQLPILFQGHRLQISGTFGSANFPSDAVNVGDLMQKADIALYQAKRSARSSFVSFRREIGDLFSDKRQAIDLVAAAIDDGRLVPFYQAKVDLKTGRCLGFEALCRIEAADGTVVGPAQFLGALNDEASAVRIGTAMLTAVTDDMAAWRAENLSFGRIAMNVTAADFAGGDLAERIKRRLDTMQIPHTSFEIEVTENTVLGREAAVVEATLRALRDSGLTISLDDFGTGYASLTHLRDAPIQYLKLDQSFIGGLGRGPESAIIVRSIIDLGHSLGMRVVAEGVETKGQSEFLRAIGCDEAQGFLFNRPMSATNTRVFLQREASLRLEAEMRSRQDGRHKIFAGSRHAS